MAGTGNVVCVTGASGYIASWLVKLLLERGYTVKASVRDLNDPAKTAHLTSLPGAKERLHLFEANLLEEGSFDGIVEGCGGVFHTASPCKLSASDPQAELLDPAVKGTLNVLRSCARVPSLKKVILTSSMAAVINSSDVKDDVVVDESWFSDPSYCEENQMWYMLSKTLAENAAWKFSKEHGIDMVTINPALVIGPPLQHSINFSVEFILNLVTGAQPFPNANLIWVDVRDVAYAHILAFEIPSASGRYCLVERFANGSQMLKVLQELYPAVDFPAKFVDSSSLTFPDYKVSQEKVKSLGIQYIPMEVSIKDTVKSFEEKNLVSL